jgi:hypothetical protein
MLRRQGIKNAGSTVGEVDLKKKFFSQISYIVQ